MEEKIVEIFAFVGIHPVSNEETIQVLENSPTDKLNGVFEWKDVAEMAFKAFYLANKQSGTAFKVLRFTFSEDVTEEFKAKL